MTGDEWYDALATYIEQHPVGGYTSRRQCIVRAIDEASLEAWWTGAVVGLVAGVVFGLLLAAAVAMTG